MFKQNGGFDVVIGNPPYVQIQKFSGQQIQKDLEKQNYATFAKTGDIYCLFYEKANRLLRDNGISCFITSNKWMRAGYGKKLRQYFLNQVGIHQLIDFGDSPIFKEATTYTNIMLSSKSQEVIQTKAWDVSNSYLANASLETMLNKAEQGSDFFNNDGFVIVPEKIGKIKKRIEAVGTPLKEWDISINYGIKTGFNEAFIIDGEKKDELIAKDPRNEEIIKPILRGRDIKRYQAEFADLWLITTFPALKIDIDNYPVVKEYLEGFLPKIKQTGETFINTGGEKEKSRKKTGNQWFETQDQISYYEEFEKEKIIYPNMTSLLPFYYETSGVLK